MRNISPLEFMNKEYFGTDIFLNNGNVLVQSGTRVTPEILMKLYFAKVYVSEKWNQEDLLNDLQYRPPVYEPETINTIMNTEESSIEKPVVEAYEDTPSYDIPASKELNSPMESDKNITEDFVDISTEKSSLIEKDENEKTKISIENLEVDTLENEEVLIEESVSEQIQEEIVEESITESLEKIEEPMLEQLQDDDDEKIVQEETPKATKIQEETERILPLEFNKEDADKLAQLAVEAGKLLNFSVGKLKELEKAGYYLRIGMPRLTTADLKNRKTFRQKLADVSYQIVMNEMHLPEPICTSIRNYVVDYNIKQFNIAGNKNIQIPNIHILAVVNCYVTLRKTRSKEDTLKEMLYIGGNKFNVFLLHKFIHMMRMRNDQ